MNIFKEIAASNKEKVLYENASDKTVFCVRLSILLTILLLLRDTKHHLFLKVKSHIPICQKRQEIHKTNTASSFDSEGISGFIFSHRNYLFIKDLLTVL